MRRDARIGAVLLIGSIAVAVLLMLPDRFFDRRHPEFHLRLDTAEGLRDGSEVWLAGNVVGNVNGIEMATSSEGRRVLVRFSIDPKAARHLTEGSRAEVRPKGMLGDWVVAIVPGRRDGAPIPIGSEVPLAVPPRTELARALDAAPDSPVDSLLRILDRVHDAIQDDIPVAGRKPEQRSLQRIRMAREHLLRSREQLDDAVTLLDEVLEMPVDAGGPPDTNEK